VRHAAAIRVNDLLNGAFGLAIPEVMPAASSGVVVPLVVAEPSESGAQNVQVVEPMIGGTGARYGADGVDGRDSGISNLANNPVETVEAEIGVEILRYALRADSGGPGQWRGGCGLELSFRVLKDGAEVLGRGMERIKFRPWGVRGGGPGAPTEFLVNVGTPNKRRYGKIDLLAVERGDVVTLRTAGAGGYGDPMARDPAQVLSDVRRGLVSKEAARTIYGVAIAGDAVDQAETARIRADKTYRSLAHESHNYGPERARFEQLFSVEMLDRLNAALFRLPTSRRSQRRADIYAAIFADLPPDFPSGPEVPIYPHRERLLAAIEALEAEIPTEAAKI
jgi:N-methylhydantoinase B